MNCPNCLCSAKIMTQWIEQHYFIEPEPATTVETLFDENDDFQLICTSDKGGNAVWASGVHEVTLEWVRQHYETVAD